MSGFFVVVVANHQFARYLSKTTTKPGRT